MRILSQRDPQWASEKLGQSPCTIGRYGCTITSISMGLDFFKKWKTPAELAKGLKFTNDGLLIWSSLPDFTAFQLENRFFGQKDDVIKKALAHPTKVVLIQVDNYHWVLGLGTNLFGGYRIADPWFGDISTTKRYGRITGGAVLSLVQPVEPQCNKACPKHCNN